ncbi:MAG TPA: hypothetical protein VFK57_17455 [Vicinamibacterales bacterium]|nr:hypothetical protein [Vicinamibacterales bacterium]
MHRRLTALTLMLLAGCGTAAVAAERDAAAGNPTPIASAIESAAKISDLSSSTQWPGDPAPRRPLALPALYGAYGTLQALDVVTTRRALGAGAQERNPLMKNGSVGAMIAVKAAAGATTIYFAERMWKKNRVGAVIVMAALNGATAAIVARNHGNR